MAAAALSPPPVILKRCRIWRLSPNEIVQNKSVCELRDFVVTVKVSPGCVWADGEVRPRWRDRRFSPLRFAFLPGGRSGQSQCDCDAVTQRLHPLAATR